MYVCVYDMEWKGIVQAFEKDTIAATLFYWESQLGWSRNIYTREFHGSQWCSGKLVDYGGDNSSGVVTAYHSLTHFFEISILNHLLFVSLCDHGYKNPTPGIIVCIPLPPPSHTQTQTQIQEQPTNQPTTILAANIRQNKPLRIVIILQRVSNVNQRAGPAGTEQIARIAVRMDLARERLERLVRETREHPIEIGRALLERLALDVAGIAHEDDSSHCRKRLH